MVKTELNDIERKAIEESLSVFYGSRKAIERFPNTTNSIDQHLTGSRPFMEKVTGDATMKLDQILASDIQKAAEAGLSEVNIHGLTFTHLACERNEGFTSKVSSMLVSAEGDPVCQMSWDFERKNDDIRVDMTIAECPADNPTYPYANRLVVSSIHRPGTKFGPGAHATAWLPDFRKLVNVMDHLREPLQEQLQNVDLGPPYLSLPISRHQLDMTTYQSVIDLDGGLPGDLCRIAGKTMLDVAYSNCFQNAGDAFGKLVKKLKSKKAVYGERYLVHNDHDNYVTVASCAATGEDALVMYANGSVSLISVENGAKGMPLKITAYHLDGGREAVDLIERWIAGEREFDAPLAEYNFDKTKGDALALSDAFVETNGGYALGGDIYYAMDSFHNMRDRDDVEISKDFDYMLSLIGPHPDDEYEGSTLGL